MQGLRIKKLGIRANSLFHRLQNSIVAYNIKFEDCDPKTFHNVPNGLESPHPIVAKTSDILFFS